MIVSPARRYVFVHAPKTGGTAMALALEARAMKDDIMAGDTPKAQARKGRLKKLGTRARLSKHSMLDELDGYLGTAELQDFFVFMLVRNPWDRMVSYYHWLQTQTFKHPVVELAARHEFAGFVAQPLVRESMRNTPYDRYVTDAAGAERCDLFIRLEHLADDIAPLETHLGFPLDIPHVNRSRREADYRAYYDDDTRALVAAMCSSDIDRFGYRFG